MSKPNVISISKDIILFLDDVSTIRMKHVTSKVKERDIDGNIMPKERWVVEFSLKSNNKDEEIYFEKEETCLSYFKQIKEILGLVKKDEETNYDI